MKAATASASSSGNSGRSQANGCVAGYGDNVGALRVKHRLAVLRAVDFELGHRLLLEAIDQY